MNDREKSDGIARIRSRLKLLEVERIRLEGRLVELERQPSLIVRAGNSASAAAQPTVTAASATTDKIALFRRLFAGRPM